MYIATLRVEGEELMKPFSDKLNAYRYLISISNLTRTAKRLLWHENVFMFNDGYYAILELNIDNPCGICTEFNCSNCDCLPK